LRRYHDLDALRGFAMLLGIAYHTGLAYTVILGAERGEWVIEWLLTYSHAFRMPLFFFIAGFFGAMLLGRDGAGGFLRGRARRLGIPLAVGLITIVPLTQALISQGRNEPLALEPVPLHLWFLEFLLVYSLAAVALASLPIPPRWSAATTWVLAGSVRRVALIPASVAIVLLAGDLPGEPWDRGVVPDVAKLLYLGGFYAVGWALWAHRERLPEVRRRWPAYLVAAIVLSLVFVELRADVAATSGYSDLLFPLLSAAIAWTAIFGLLGLAARWCDAERPAVRYVVDASYWMYLVHPPLVFVLVAALRDTGLPWWLQLTIAVAANIAVGLATYAAFVRHTVIGDVLHGPRPGRFVWGRRPERRLRQSEGRA
jgi:surface polysaccharide O-acyltransferase-like enzyme